MFGIERLQAIRELLLEKKSVEVAYLSKELGVSEVTIRRDLDKLEKEGFIAKTYGGAILIEEGTGNVDRFEDAGGEGILLADKSLYDSTVHTAAKLIEPGDTIFIGGSSMGSALAKSLKSLDGLIVITNNLEIAMYLFRHTDHKVIIIGGEVDVLSGNVLEFDQLEELLIEKTFFSVDGVDMQFGYTANEKADVRLFKALKEVSRDMILVTVNDVYNKRGLVKLAPLDAVANVVGEKDMPDTFKKYYYEHNIKVHASILQKD